jgi:hypothetical protein
LRFALSRKQDTNQLNELPKEQHIHEENDRTLSETEGRIRLGARTLDAARNRILEARLKGTRRKDSGTSQEREAAGIAFLIKIGIRASRCIGERVPPWQGQKIAKVWAKSFLTQRRRDRRDFE